MDRIGSTEFGEDERSELLLLRYGAKDEMDRGTIRILQSGGKAFDVGRRTITTITENRKKDRLPFHGIGRELARVGVELYLDGFDIGTARIENKLSTADRPAVLIRNTGL